MNVFTLIGEQPVFAGNNVKGIVIASNDVDSAVRVSAVRAISQLVEDAAQPVEDDGRASLGRALLARIFDGNASVLDALYANPKPIARLINDSPKQISILASSLLEQGLSKSLLRSHLSFFCNAFVEFYPAHVPRIMLSLVVPFMLRTKPRAKTAAVVWEVVLNSKLGQMRVMAGLKEFAEDSAESSDVNDLVASRLAGKYSGSLNKPRFSKTLADNLRTEDALPEYLDGLLKHATNSADAHTRLSVWLILRHMFTALSLEDRLVVLRRLFDSAVLGKIIDDSGSKIDVSFDEQTLQRVIFSKPNSSSTMSKLQLSFLAELSATLSFEGKKVQWLASKAVSGSSSYPVVANLKAQML